MVSFLEGTAVTMKKINDLMKGNRAVINKVAIGAQNISFHIEICLTSEKIRSERTWGEKREHGERREAMYSSTSWTNSCRDDFCFGPFAGESYAISYVYN